MQLDWRPSELFRRMLGLPETTKVFLLKSEHLTELKSQDSRNNHMTASGFLEKLGIEKAKEVLIVVGDFAKT